MRQYIITIWGTWIVKELCKVFSKESCMFFVRGVEHVDGSTLSVEMAFGNFFKEVVVVFSWVIMGNMVGVVTGDTDGEKLVSIDAKPGLFPK
eukprot:15346224-Ditylum_brightwellii.AAC.1